MKKPFFVLFALLLLAAPAYAQVTPTPAPTPDPHVYVDHAMYLVVPNDYSLLGRRTVQVAQLGGKLEPLAVWAKHYHRDSISLTLMAEGDNETLNAWLVTFKNEIREKIGNVFIKKSTLGTLKNGMPAYWVTLSYGSGFTSRKREGWVWSDGQRGIFLSVDFPIEAMSEKEAKAALSNVRATMYPRIDE